MILAFSKSGPYEGNVWNKKSKTVENLNFVNIEYKIADIFIQYFKLNFLLNNRGFSLKMSYLKTIL